MTRDQVLDEAAKALDEIGWNHSGDVVRALKSKPPEKSPEVECGRCVAAEEKWHELAALRTADALEFGRVVAERDDLRAEVARLKWEAADAPMQGEHAGDPTACAACEEGYPPPPGEPAPR